MLEAALHLRARGLVRGDLGLVVGGGPVEMGGDGVLLVVEPLEQQAERLLRVGPVTRPNSEPGRGVAPPSR